MVKALPSSFVSFDAGKLTLSHKLGFMKFNWTFHAQPANLPFFMLHEMIIPLLHKSNPIPNEEITQSDLTILNQLPTRIGLETVEPIKQSLPSIEPTAVASSAEPAIFPEQPKPSIPPTAVPEPMPSTVSETIPSTMPEVKPAGSQQEAELAKRKELEEMLAKQTAPKKKNRLI